MLSHLTVKGISLKKRNTRKLVGESGIPVKNQKTLQNPQKNTNKNSKKPPNTTKKEELYVDQLNGVTAAS